MNVSKQKNIILTVSLSIAILACKVACCVVYFNTVFPHDTLLLLLSAVYYFLTVTLCFFGGKVKHFTKALWGVCILESILFLIISLFQNAWKVAWFNWICVFLLGSHYLVSNIIHSFEPEGEIFPDLIYCLAVIAMFALFILIHTIGKKAFARKDR